MSQRPGASRPASRSPRDDERLVLPPVQSGGFYEHDGQQVEQRIGDDREGMQRARISLPAHQVRAAPSGIFKDEWRTSALSKDLGVRSILNPIESESITAVSRRQSTNTVASPSSAVSTSHFGASPSTQHSFPNRQSARILPTHASMQYPHQRVRTPRSPRVLSLGRGSGINDAHQSSFVYGRSRAYTAGPGPGHGHDLNPTPPPQPRQQYGFPPVTTPLDQARRYSGSMPALGRTSVSEDLSPSMSASSQNLSSQTSPTSYAYTPTGQPPISGSYFPGTSFGQQQGGGGAIAVSEGPYSASHSQVAAPPSFSSCSTAVSGGGSSSRQPSVTRDSMSMMTISTSQGLIHVPVDTHQASRLADEKRARNAGASARFRQRRKDKEREASNNIDRLQQQVRDLQSRLRETEAQRDFYRNERDRLRDVVTRTLGIRETAMQAPPSPQPLEPGRHGSFGARPMGPTLTFQIPEPSVERPSRRQRMNIQGDFQGVPYPISQGSASLPPVQSPLVGLPPPHLGLPNLPPLRIDNPAFAPTTSAGPASLPSASGPGSAGGHQALYDPGYHREGYDRVWPGDPGDRRGL